MYRFKYFLYIFIITSLNKNEILQTNLQVKYLLYSFEPSDKFEKIDTHKTHSHCILHPSLQKLRRKQIKF